MSVWRDNIRITSLITGTRLLNLVRLKISYWSMKLGWNWSAKARPFSLSIEPTTACNLGCPECPSGLKKFTRPTGKLDLNFHEKMLEQVHKHVFYINYYFQGEPFLHPQFLDLIVKAKAKKIYTATSTNAHFIDAKKAEDIVKSGLDRLIISIDGTTQETYENYRIHGTLEKVLSGTKAMIAAKKKLGSSTPHLIFQFLVVKPNEHQIDEVKEMAREYGVDEIRLKTAQFYDYEQGNSLMPSIEKYRRYRQKSDGSFAIKNKMLNTCWRMWSSTVFTWDGKVVPCCFDKDAQHVLGDLQKESFEKVWTSDAYQGFRKAVFTQRAEIDICKNCTEGTRVWA